MNQTTWSLSTLKKEECGFWTTERRASRPSGNYTRTVPTCPLSTLITTCDSAGLVTTVTYLTLKAEDMIILGHLAITCFEE
jgi:hypothetical protein